MKQKSLKNTIRNIALVVLTVLMFVLTALSGLSAMGSAGASPFRAFHRTLSHVNLGYEVRTDDSPAAYPSSIAMTNGEGMLCGAAYNERAVAQLYEVTREVMGGALSAAGDFRPMEESELRELLAGETLLYAYNGEIPVSVLAAWMEGTSKSEQNASMALVTRDGQLVLRTREEGLLCAKTSIDRSGWSRAAETLSAGECTYAGTSGSAVCRRLAAETLIFDDAPVGADILAYEAPSFGDPTASDSLQTLLNAFSYSMYARSYPERDAQVYVDNDSTLRISADGTISYTAAWSETAAEPLPLVMAIERARVLLEQAQYSIGAGTQSELLSVTDRGDGSETLLFGLVYEGIPIADDEPYARFDYENGQLVRVSIRLQRFSAAGGRQYVLPAAQAAAAAPQEGQRIGIAYLAGENGAYAAERCYTFVS